MTPPDGTPACSVLICTWNRAQLLRCTLESLRAQSLDARDFEVVVVDDGSTDDTRAVVQGFADRLRIHYQYQRPSGLASARNHALFLARGPIVILQDDDDIAAPHLVEEHLRAHREHPEPATAVLGRTELFCGIAEDPLMKFVTRVEHFLFSYPGVVDDQVLGFEHFWGGRSSCKRRFLLEHGVFDPRFRFGCEDIELAYRLRSFGFRVVYRERALSAMVRAFSFDEFCGRLVRQGRSNWTFSQLHPDPEVRRWTDVDGALEHWRQVSPVYDAMLGAARKLDHVVRARRDLGLPTHRELPMVYELYGAAFRASKAKGVAEGAAAP